MLIVGEAIEYLIRNTFTESSGARKGFPKVAVVITDGKSQDEVEIPARELHNIGVEIFSLGMLKLIQKSLPGISGKHFSFALCFL